MFRGEPVQHRLQHFPAPDHQVPAKVVAAGLVVRHAELRPAALLLDEIHDAAQAVPLGQRDLRLDASRIVLGSAPEPEPELERDRAPVRMTDRRLLEPHAEIGAHVLAGWETAPGVYT